MTAEHAVGATNESSAVAPKGSLRSKRSSGSHPWRARFSLSAVLGRLWSAIDAANQHDLRCLGNEIEFHLMEQHRGALRRIGLVATVPHTEPPPRFVIEATGVNHAYEGQTGWVHALENFEIADPAQRISLSARSLGLRQEFLSAHRHRIDEAARRRDPSRWQADRRARARPRDRFPRAGAVSLAHSPAQCRVRPGNERHGQARGQRARGRGAAHRRSRACHAPLSVPALRRHEASRGRRAGLGVAGRLAFCSWTSHFRRSMRSTG